MVGRWGGGDQPPGVHATLHVAHLFSVHPLVLTPCSPSLLFSSFTPKRDAASRRCSSSMSRLSRHNLKLPEIAEHSNTIAVVNSGGPSAATKGARPEVELVILVLPTPTCGFALPAPPATKSCPRLPRQRSFDTYIYLQYLPALHP